MTLKMPLFLSDLLTGHEAGRDALPRVQADRQVGATRFTGRSHPSRFSMIAAGLAAAGALLSTAPLAATAANSAPEQMPQFSHSREITNPYLPLASLKQDILEGKTERVERTAKPELHKSFNIGGQIIEALAIEDREYANGKLSEVTLDYFAQADEGTVYYLGEDVDEYKDGKVTGHSGGWLLGKDTTHPGVLVPGHPKVGDKFRSEDVPKVTREDDEVISVSETVTVLGRTYRNCLKIKESPSDGKPEFKLYAPGVGCVKEIEQDAELSLKSHESTPASM